LASVIDAISEADNGDTAWQPLALTILAEARSKDKVFAAYFRQFRQMSWSGSRASIMEGRLGLFDDLMLMPKLSRYHSFIQNERPILQVTLNEIVYWINGFTVPAPRPRVEMKYLRLPVGPYASVQPPIRICQQPQNPMN
jgi:hypothetical protein